MVAVETVDTDGGSTPLRRSTGFDAGQSSVTDWLVWGCTSQPLLPHWSVPARSCGR